MNIVLTEAQQMLKRSARDFLQEECPLDHVRAMETDTLGYSPQLWRQMAGLGWLAWPFPAQYGGADGDFFEFALVLEEMGYAAVPTPLFSSIVQAGFTVLEAGSSAQKQDILPQLASGERLFAPAYFETDNDPVALNCTTTARAQNDRFVLQGSKCFVPDAQIANTILWVAQVQSGHTTDRALSLFLIDPQHAAVHLRSMQTATGNNLFEVSLAQLDVDRSAVLGQCHTARPALQRALLRSTALKCAEMVGGIQAVLDMTVEYVKQRVQFGRPIGTFQAVQHHCANMYRDLEIGRLLTYQACWNIAQGLPAEASVAAAKLKLSRAYPEITRLAHRVTGGVGYYTEYPLELYTRRALAAANAFGGAADHARHLADTLWG